MQLTYDDINSFVLSLHDFLVNNLGCVLDENEDYQLLGDFIFDNLDKYSTGDFGNYN